MKHEQLLVSMERGWFFLLLYLVIRFAYEEVLTENTEIYSRMYTSIVWVFPLSRIVPRVVKLF